MKWQFTFRLKIQLLLVSVSFLSLVLLGVEAYQSAVAFRMGKEALVKAAADGLMDKIDRNLFERYGDVQAFASSEPARSTDPIRIREFMNDMMTTYAPIYDLMIVTDTNGKVIAVSTKDENGKDIASQGLLGMDYSKTNWFRQAVSDKFAAGTSVVEDLHIDEDVARILGNDGRVMNFTAPIRDKASGKVLGVWTNRMSWPHVVEAITKEENEKVRSEQVITSDAYLIDQKGIYLLHPEAQEYELKKSHDRGTKEKSNVASNQVREVQVSTPNFTGSALEARAKSKGYSTYPGRGWTAILQVPAEDAQMRANNQIIIFAFLLIVIANIISFFVLSRLSGKIEKVATRMTSESTQVKNTANQISVASQQLSESTTEQAAAIEETAASMEEITAMLSHTTQNAAQCKDLSEQGQAEAQKGKQVITKMSSAMEEIQFANDKLDRLVAMIGEIGDKTKIINDIVSETRLLSFNASIEAARAGAHGKGFAVVAEEVGKLASISGKAADEIKELLDSSVKEVSEVVKETQARVHLGKTISQDCETAFGSMGSAMERMNDLIKTIAVAAKDQEVGIKQVTRAIGEMDKVTQANSRNAEMLSDQATGLHSGAESLNSSIGVIQMIISGQALPIHTSAEKKGADSTGENLVLEKASQPSLNVGRGDSRWKESA
jgi:methyl-accepting chemotaxis protein